MDSDEPRRYQLAETALAAHLDTCRLCPTGTCEAGFALAQAESRTWWAWAVADPQAAAAYQAQVADYQAQVAARSAAAA